MTKKERKLQNMDNLFDLITVSFGYYTTQARPSDFFKDDQDNFIAVKKISTSCPVCGHGVEADIVAPIVDGVYNLSLFCENCEAGYKEDPSSPKQVEIMGTFENDTVEDKEEDEDFSNIVANNLEDDIVVNWDSKVKAYRCPFIDPIEKGLFSVDAI
jgi:hypothetical protein